MPANQARKDANRATAMYFASLGVLTEAGLAKALRISRRQARRIMAELRDEQLIIPGDLVPRSGEQGRPARQWKLAEEG